MPFFDSIKMLPEDPILGIPLAIKADPRPNIVNLGIGAYKTADGKSYVLNCVRKAESEILKRNLNKDYLPIEGDPEFLLEIQKLIFGKDAEVISSGRIFGAQTIGGSYALKLAGEFFTKEITKTIYVPDPTWPNHVLIFQRAGFNVLSYPYYSQKNHEITFSEMSDAIKKMAPGSVILLHGCCQNPTGIDPSMEQWKQLSILLRQYEIIPFFDLAYQGFGDGIDADAAAVRYFAQHHHEMFISYSCSKNFGLYGERVGALFALAHRKEAANCIGSHLKTLIRGTYSSPQLHGSRIVTVILRSDELQKEWRTELSNMQYRVAEMRTAFSADLQTKVDHLDFSFIHKQKGLFSFCGLNSVQVERLRFEKGIYMPANGRINIAGLNTQNLNYVVESIASVLKPT